MKTTWTGFSGAKIDLLPHVERAARLFGEVRLEAVPRLAGLIARHMDDGHSADLVGRAGHALTEERMKAIGLDPWLPFSREAYDALTEAGRSEPREAIRRLVERATAWAYDEEGARQRTDPDVVRIFDIVVFHCDKGSCEAARRLDGAVFPAASAPRVPLDACRNDGCRCGVEVEMSRRPRRK